MEDTHRERQGRGGVGEQGPRETDVCLPGAGGPGGLPPAVPTPTLGCSSWGWVHLHALPSQTLQPMYSAPAPLALPLDSGGPTDGCLTLQVVRSYKATIQQTLDILFPSGKAPSPEQHRCFKPGLCRPHHHCLGFPELRQDLLTRSSM